MEVLGNNVRSSGTVYFTGGVTALLMGWRQATIDIDLKFDPEPEGAFNLLPRIKDELEVNIEEASPDNFLPPLPGWRERSILIGQFGRIEYFHYDLYSQVMAKIERGHSQDLVDIEEIFKRGLIVPTELARLFEQIKPLLIRYPAIDADELNQKVEETIGHYSQARTK